MKNIYTHAFGKNDIRGIYGDDITEKLFFNIGKNLVLYLHTKSGILPENMYITVCMDARTHSPSLANSLMHGIISNNAHVIFLGLAPTPIGYYSEFSEIPSEFTNGKNIISACIITASHNPKEYNGLKITYNHHTLSESDIVELRDMTFSNWSESPSKQEFKKSEIIKYNIIPTYIDDMLSKFGKIGKGIKVVVDSANATGGIVAPELYKKMGCEVIELFSEPDGNFPNHHPNPSVESTLDVLKKSVTDNQADLGIAFDGDSDRIGVVDDKGHFLTGDKLLLAFSVDVIDEYRKKGITPDIVSEVKCSQVLYDTIDKIGGKSHMCKTGHGYVKAMMRETGAILAGEMSGHTFFKDRYFGFDDAIYAGCRIIEIISKNKQKNPKFSIRDLIKPFDEVFTSAEVRYPCPNELKSITLKNIEDLIKNESDIFSTNIRDIITIDGMRIVFDDGFALIRQSNTEPVFTLRFEASDDQTCKKYKDIMIKLLDNILKAKL